MLYWEEVWFLLRPLKLQVAFLLVAATIAYIAAYFWGIVYSPVGLGVYAFLVMILGGGRVAAMLIGYMEDKMSQEMWRQ